MEGEIPVADQYGPARSRAAPNPAGASPAPAPGGVLVPAGPQPGQLPAGTRPGRDAWQGIFVPSPVQAPHSPRAPGELRRDLIRLLREPLGWRARRERSFAGFGLLLELPAVLLFAAIVLGLGLSLSFAGMVAGVPLLVASLLCARRLGAAHRGLARWLLGLRVPAPPQVQARPGVLGWARAGLTDRAGWRALGYLLVKLPLSVFAGVFASLILFYGIPYLTFPVWWPVLHVLAEHGVVIQIAGWLHWWTWDPVLVAYQTHTLAGTFVFVPVGAIVILGNPSLVGTVNKIDAKLIAGLLGPPLPQRVRDLERARAHAVDDSAARLRRIERDLHDGAQAQMVAVAMKLGLAREKLGGTASGPAPGTAVADIGRALELIDAAHRSAKQAIIELRDLARGIHPPVLDHGLGTALETLAASSGLPVELVADLPARPSAAIETIAYFCACELLANAAKHSGARHVTVEAVHVSGLLRLRVSDDGAGGAAIVPGSGLAGLAGRLATVDGTIAISSPRAGPTVVTVEMPSHA